MRAAAVVLLATTLVTNTAQAQPAVPATTPENVVCDLGEVLARYLALLAADETAHFTLTSPTLEQVASPASVEGSTTLVNSPSFPALFGMAIENGLINSSANAVTLDLNAFAFAAMLRPEIVDRPELYEDYQTMRRFGGSLSLGKKGESFDRNGDGTADPALDAENPGDIINVELRWRLLGSRDRRDRSNVDVLFAEARSDFGARALQLQTGFFNRFSDRLEQALTPGSGDRCYDRQKLEALLNQPDVIEALLPAARIDHALRQKIEGAQQKIDSHPILTFVAGTKQQRPEFGPDGWMVGLRGAIGPTNNQFSLEASATQREGLFGAPDPRVVKLGTKYSRLVGKGRRPFGPNGATLSGSGSYEWLEDVPGARYDQVAKANAQIEIHVFRGVKLPISVTWANHDDLVTGEEEVRGHIGFTVDWSRLVIGPR